MTPHVSSPLSDQTTYFPQVHHLAAAVQQDREGGSWLGGTAGCDALGLQRARDLQRWQHALTAAAGHGWADAPRPHAPPGEASGHLLCTRQYDASGVQGGTPAMGIDCVSSTLLLLASVSTMALELS